MERYATEVLKLALIVSVVADVGLLSLCMAIKDGPAWTVFRLLILTHAVTGFGALWGMWSSHVNIGGHPGFILNAAGRFAGSLVGIVLAVMLARTYGHWPYRKPTRRTR